MSHAAPPPPPDKPDDLSSQDPPVTAGPPAGYPPPSSPPPSSPPVPPASGGTTPAASRSPGGLPAPMAEAHNFDLAQIGLGVLLFIASLLPFYSYSVTAGGFSAGGSLTAWHGFFGWFGVLLGVAAAAVLAVALFAHTTIPSMRLVVLGLFAASALCLLLALFVIPGGGYDGAGFSSGHSFGYWLALLSSLAGTALAYLRKDVSDSATAV